MRKLWRKDEQFNQRLLDDSSLDQKWQDLTLVLTSRHSRPSWPNEPFRQLVHPTGRITHAGLWISWRDGRICKGQEQRLSAAVWAELRGLTARLWKKMRDCGVNMNYRLRKHTRHYRCDQDWSQEKPNSGSERSWRIQMLLSHSPRWILYKRENRVCWRESSGLTKRKPLPPELRQRSTQNAPSWATYSHKNTKVTKRNSKVYKIKYVLFKLQIYTAIK